MVICAVKDTGINVTFWAGCIVLAGVDDCNSAGHFSSGFERGLRLSNMSVCEIDGVGVGSSIVAYEATRRNESECSCLRMNM